MSFTETKQSTEKQPLPNPQTTPTPHDCNSGGFLIHCDMPISKDRPFSPLASTTTLTSPGNSPTPASFPSSSHHPSNLTQSLQEPDLSCPPAHNSSSSPPPLFSSKSTPSRNIMYPSESYFFEQKKKTNSGCFPEECGSDSYNPEFPVPELGCDMPIIKNKPTMPISPTPSTPSTSHIASPSTASSSQAGAFSTKLHGAVSGGVRRESDDQMNFSISRTTFPLKNSFESGGDSSDKSSERDQYPSTNIFPYKGLNSPSHSIPPDSSSFHDFQHTPRSTYNIPPHHQTVAPPSPVLPSANQSPFNQPSSANSSSKEHHTPASPQHAAQMSVSPPNKTSPHSVTTNPPTPNTNSVQNQSFPPSPPTFPKSRNGTPKPTPKMPNKSLLPTSPLNTTSNINLVSSPDSSNRNALDVYAQMDLELIKYKQTQQQQQSIYSPKEIDIDAFKQKQQPQLSLYEQLDQEMMSYMELSTSSSITSSTSKSNSQSTSSQKKKHSRAVSTKKDKNERKGKHHGKDDEGSDDFKSHSFASELPIINNTKRQQPSEPVLKMSPNDDHDDDDQPSTAVPFIVTTIDLPIRSGMLLSTPDHQNQSSNPNSAASTPLVSSLQPPRSSHNLYAQHPTTPSPQPLRSNTLNERTKALYDMNLRFTPQSQFSTFHSTSTPNSAQEQGVYSRLQLSHFLTGSTLPSENFKPSSLDPMATSIDFTQSRSKLFKNNLTFSTNLVHCVEDATFQVCAGISTVADTVDFLYRIQSAFRAFCKAFYGNPRSRNNSATMNNVFPSSSTNRGELIKTYSSLATQGPAGNILGAKTLPQFNTAPNAVSSGLNPPHQQPTGGIPNSTSTNSIPIASQLNIASNDSDGPHTMFHQKNLENHRLKSKWYLDSNSAALRVLTQHNANFNLWSSGTNSELLDPYLNDQHRRSISSNTYSTTPTHTSTPSYDDSLAQTNTDLHNPQRFFLQNQRYDRADAFLHLLEKMEQSTNAFASSMFIFADALRNELYYPLKRISAQLQQSKGKILTNLGVIQELSQQQRSQLHRLFRLTVQARTFWEKILALEGLLESIRVYSTEKERSEPSLVPPQPRYHASGSTPGQALSIANTRTSTHLSSTFSRTTGMSSETAQEYSAENTNNSSNPATISSHALTNDALTVNTFYTDPGSCVLSNIEGDMSTEQSGDSYRMSTGGLRIKNLPTIKTATATNHTKAPSSHDGDNDQWVGLSRQYSHSRSSSSSSSVTSMNSYNNMDGHEMAPMQKQTLHRNLDDTDEHGMGHEYYSHKLSYMQHPEVPKQLIQALPPPQDPSSKRTSSSTKTGLQTQTPSFYHDNVKSGIHQVPSYILSDEQRLRDYKKHKELELSALYMHCKKLFFQIECLQHERNSALQKLYQETIPNFLQVCENLEKDRLYALQTILGRFHSTYSTFLFNQTLDIPDQLHRAAASFDAYSDRSPSNSLSLNNAQAEPLQSNRRSSIHPYASGVSDYIDALNEQEPLNNNNRRGSISQIFPSLPTTTSLLQPQNNQSHQMMKSTLDSIKQLIDANHFKSFSHSLSFLNISDTISAYVEDFQDFLSPSSVSYTHITLPAPSTYLAHLGDFSTNSYRSRIPHLVFQNTLTVRQFDPSTESGANLPQYSCAIHPYLLACDITDFEEIDQKLLQTKQDKKREKKDKSVPIKSTAAYAHPWSQELTSFIVSQVLQTNSTSIATHSWYPQLPSRPKIYKVSAAYNETTWLYTELLKMYLHSQLQSAPPFLLTDLLVNRRASSSHTQRPLLLQPEFVQHSSLQSLSNHQHQHRTPSQPQLFPHIPQTAQVWAREALTTPSGETSNSGTPDSSQLRQLNSMIPTTDLSIDPTASSSNALHVNTISSQLDPLQPAVRPNQSNIKTTPHAYIFDQSVQFMRLSQAFSTVFANPNNYAPFVVPATSYVVEVDDAPFHVNPKDIKRWNQQYTQQCEKLLNPLTKTCLQHTAEFKSDSPICHSWLYNALGYPLHRLSSRPASPSFSANTDLFQSFSHGYHPNMNLNTDDLNDNIGFPHSASTNTTSSPLLPALPSPVIPQPSASPQHVLTSTTQFLPIEYNSGDLRHASQSDTQSERAEFHDQQHSPRRQVDEIGFSRTFSYSSSSIAQRSVSAKVSPYDPNRASANPPKRNDSASSSSSISHSMSSNNTNAARQLIKPLDFSMSTSSGKARISSSNSITMSRTGSPLVYQAPISTSSSQHSAFSSGHPALKVDLDLTDLPYNSPLPLPPSPLDGDSANVPAFRDIIVDSGIGTVHANDFSFDQQTQATSSHHALSSISTSSHSDHDHDANDSSDSNPYDLQLLKSLPTSPIPSTETLLQQQNNNPTQRSNIIPISSSMLPSDAYSRLYDRKQYKFVELITAPGQQRSVAHHLNYLDHIQSNSGFRQQSPFNAPTSLQLPISTNSVIGFQHSSSGLVSPTNKQNSFRYPPNTSPFLQPKQDSVPDHHFTPHHHHHHHHHQQQQHPFLPNPTATSCFHSPRASDTDQTFLRSSIPPAPTPTSPYLQSISVQLPHSTSLPSLSVPGQHQLLLSTPADLIPLSTSLSHIPFPQSTPAASIIDIQIHTPIPTLEASPMPGRPSFTSNTLPQHITHRPSSALSITSRNSLTITPRQFLQTSLAPEQLHICPQNKTFDPNHLSFITASALRQRNMLSNNAPSHGYIPEQYLQPVSLSETSIGIAECLMYPRLHQVFSSFLRHSFSFENLQYWTLVRRFRTCPWDLDDNFTQVHMVMSMNSPSHDNANHAINSTALGDTDPSPPHTHGDDGDNLSTHSCVHTIQPTNLPTIRPSQVVSFAPNLPYLNKATSVIIPPHQTPQPPPQPAPYSHSQPPVPPEVNQIEPNSLTTIITSAPPSNQSTLNLSLNTQSTTLTHHKPSLVSPLNSTWNTQNTSTADSYSVNNSSSSNTDKDTISTATALHPPPPPPSSGIPLLSALARNVRRNSTSTFASSLVSKFMDGAIGNTGSNFTSSGTKLNPGSPQTPLGAPLPSNIVSITAPRKDSNVSLASIHSGTSSTSNSGISLNALHNKAKNAPIIPPQYQNKPRAWKQEESLINALQSTLYPSPLTNLILPPPSPPQSDQFSSNLDLQGDSSTPNDNSEHPTNPHSLHLYHSHSSQFDSSPTQIGNIMRDLKYSDVYYYSPQCFVETALYIFDQFLAQDATTEVNLPGAISKPLRHILEKQRDEYKRWTAERLDIILKWERNSHNSQHFEGLSSLILKLGKWTGLYGHGTCLSPATGDDELQPPHNSFSFDIPQVQEQMANSLPKHAQLGLADAAKNVSQISPLPHTTSTPGQPKLFPITPTSPFPIIPPLKLVIHRNLFIETEQEILQLLSRDQFSRLKTDPTFLMALRTLIVPQ